MLWIAAATALLLVGLAARAEAWRRDAPRLPSPLQGAMSPPTVALLPARDEETNIVPCVETLLALSSAPRVLVIDDGSSDRTRALVTEVAANQPRLTVVSARPLPPGWRGKVNALESGLSDTLEPWILLTDADARLAPQLLARAHAGIAHWSLDALSIAGTQEAHAPGEQFLVPAVFGLLDLLLGDWHAAADGTGPAVASGQFVLVRRAALVASGGFEAIRRAVIDDVALVTNLRRHGFRTGFVRAPDLLRVRMYDGLAAAVAGWRRNLGAIFAGRGAEAALALAWLVLPPVLLAVAAGVGAWPAFWLAWTGGAAASAGLRLGSAHPVWPALFYPADFLLLAAVLALGMVDYRRGRLASWKGRTIDV